VNKALDYDVKKELHSSRRTIYWVPIKPCFYLQYYFEKLTHTRARTYNEYKTFLDHLNKGGREEVGGYHYNSKPAVTITIAGVRLTMK